MSMKPPFFAGPIRPIQFLSRANAPPEINAPPVGIFVPHCVAFSQQPASHTRVSAVKIKAVPSRRESPRSVALTNLELF